MDTRTEPGRKKHLNAAGTAWFLIYLLYVLFAGYPIGPYEPDGTTIANGTYFLDQLVEAGGESGKPTGWKGLIYRYDVQAGTYQLIRIGHGLTQWDYYTVFSIICSLAFLGVVLFASRFLSQAAAIPYWLAGLSLLAFPEMMAVSGYPNSNIIALLFLAMSMALAIRPSLTHTVLSACALSVAVWCRFDAVLLIPAYTVALWMPRKNPIKDIFIAGCIVAFSTMLLLLLSGTSILAVLRALGNHAAQWESRELTVANYIAFFPLLVVFLAALGIVQLIKEKAYKPLLFTGIGSLPVFLAYGWTVTTGKYLLYAAIPLALLVVNGGLFIYQCRRLLQVPLLMIALAMLMYAYPPLNWPAYHGTVYSHDGTRHITKLLSTPLNIHKEKYRKRKAFQEVADFIKETAASNEHIQIATCDRHEITANLTSEFLGREDTELRFIQNNPDHTKLFHLSLGDASVDFLAFYSGAELPDVLTDNSPGDRAIYLVYWTRWPPKSAIPLEREIVFHNSRLTVEKAIQL